MKKERVSNYWLWLVQTGLCLAISFLGAGHCAAESLFEPEKFSSLTEDVRAREVGDAITLLILETSSAKAQADTSTDQELGVNANLSDTERSESANLDLGMSRGASGATARQGALKAQISARIEQVEESGMLFINGIQEIVVNGEQQVIKASGWVRADDITPENTVYSSRLTDAKIEYTGYGSVGDANTEGYLYKMLNFLGLI